MYSVRNMAVFLDLFGVRYRIRKFFLQHFSDVEIRLGTEYEQPDLAQASICIERIAWIARGYANKSP
mgnify:CR=1 FL=1